MGILQRVRSALWHAQFTVTEPPPYTPVLLSRSLMTGHGLLGSVSREDALSIPGVLRGRNMICSIATLPLQAVWSDNRVADHPLLQQYDADVPNVVVMAQTVEDLLFESIAWWRITDWDWIEPGYLVPAAIQRYAPDTVSFQPPSNYQRGYLPSGYASTGTIWMDGEEVPFFSVIRFDSPNPPLLEVAQRSIRRAIALDEAAEMYAEEPRPTGFFTPSDPQVDPVDDDDVEALLDAWAVSRKERTTAYVPAALKYQESQQPTPADLQLVQLQQRVTLDVANALGLDPEDLGISTTSRTYQNATDRRKDRINDVLSMYLTAITDRLNMPDVTPPELHTQFKLDDYLKADPKTRAEVQQIYMATGVTDADEVRQAESYPPRIRPQQPAQQRPTVDPSAPASAGAEVGRSRPIREPWENA